MEYYLVNDCSFFADVQPNMFMHMYGGKSQIVYRVVDDCDARGYCTQNIQEALTLLSKTNCGHIQTCVVFEKGYTLITNSSRLYLSVYEQPFDVSVQGSCLSLHKARRYFARVRRRLHRGTEHEDVCFGLAFLYFVVLNEMLSSDVVDYNIVDFDEYSHIFSFVNNVHASHKQVFTEFGVSYDTKRVISLLDASYVLYLELPKSCDYMECDGSFTTLKESHAVVFFKSDDGQYNLADMAGVRVLSESDIDKMLCSASRFSFCGCMLIGVLPEMVDDETH